MSSVKNVDALASQSVEDPAEFSITNLSFGRPCTLIFLNLTQKRSLLKRKGGCPLGSVLSDLADILADDGSLVLPLEGWEVDHTFLRREF